jgi:two-component system LytT family response regulator
MEKAIRTIIVDDEERARAGLTSLLQSVCPGVEVVADAKDIDTAFTLINQHKPDFIFLDIQMPTGSGFNLLQKFNDLFFDVIFVTGYDEFAINAIKFSALDYLLKPIEVSDLTDAVQKAISNKEKKADRKIQIVNLLNMTDADVVEKRIVVHQNEKVQLLKIGSIAYIEADDRYCHIVVQSGEKYTVTKTLKEFEDFLELNRTFFRINKNYMLNINFIRNYTKGEPCFVELFDGSNFEVSRRKKQEFLERLKNK